MNKLFSTLDVEDVLKTLIPSYNFPFSVSPNGEWLAFTIDGLTPKKSSTGVSVCVEGCSQWVCHIESGKVFQIMPEALSSWSGVWSPEGLSLSFFADKDGVARLWIWDPTNNSLKQSSIIGARPFFGFESPIWTIDGKSVIYKAMPDGDVDNSGFLMKSFINQDLIDGNNIQVFSTEKTSNDLQVENWVERYRADLVRWDLDTGKTTYIVRNLYPVGMKLSNDGKKIAFTSALGQEMVNGNQVNYDLWVASVFPQEIDVSICLVKKVRMTYGLSFSWSKDGNSILYTTDGPLSEGNLWTVNVSGDRIHHQLIQDNKVHFGREYDAPLQLKNGDALMVANFSLWRYKKQDGEITALAPVLQKQILALLPFIFESEYVIVQTKDQENNLYGFWKVNFITGEVEKILEESRGHYLSYEGGATVGKKANIHFIAYISHSCSEPPSPWIVNIETKENRQISELTSFTKENLGTAQLLDWELKGRKLHGALLLPPKRTGRVPVIIRVYDGKLSDRLHNFGLWNNLVDNHHLFASRGYAVLLPDLIVEGNEPSEEITRGLEVAILALKKHPDIDVERIGIIGHSYGGYAALVGISRLQNFRAAVVSAGIGNLISFSTMFHPRDPDLLFGLVEGGQGYMLGNNIWENRERYIRNSPIFEFDQVNTPVLIVQGTKDHLCFIESGSIYSSLRRLGKKAELIYYNGEHHWQGTWQLENIKDYYNRIFRWFDEHL
jgi:dienelactone hydrolase/Tol biopolymer transport system component